jgi:heterogeneous nuclear ribonucleoprotein F/H
MVRSSDEIHLGEEHHHHKDTTGGELFGMIPSSYPSQSSVGGLSGGRGDGGSRRGGGGGGESLGSGSMGGRGNIGRMNPPGLIVKRTGGGIQVGDHTGFLRMRGLPFSASKDDIYIFFEEYNTVENSIVLTYRSDGRATGEAYVQFQTHEDSKRAMDLHRKIMGNRYIELFLSNKEEHGRALTRFGDR